MVIDFISEGTIFKPDSIKKFCSSGCNKEVQWIYYKEGKAKMLCDECKIEAINQE
jgi:hypothetical protein